MRIGALDRRIIIESATWAQDSVGEELPTWSTLATVWARKDEGAALERLKAQQPLAEAEVLFTIRHRADVTPRMRVSFGGAYYDILAVTEGPGRKQWTRLACRVLR